ncbi:MAG: hypothetical protein JXA14_06235 [Anaerolineae bacterium]|nr:hypothetical protein [Anaerolineae bacterium]
MARRPQHWVIGGFILLAVFVIAFVLVNLLLSQGIGLPATFLILPSEVTLHPGEGWQFRAVAGDRVIPGVKWTATDGDIGPEGFYVAPDTPGDYQIIAQHPNSNYRSAATVHVVGAENAVTEQPINLTETTTPVQPTITSTAAPTTTPVRPTPAEPTTASPTTTPTRTSSPSPSIFFDDVGDLVSFDTLESVVIAPPGTDIRAACFTGGRQLIRTLPEELAGEISDWDTEENLVLWLTFHEPVPTVPDMERYWIFALDADNNTATGRPVGEGIINPDIGVEATIGVHSDPAAGIELAPYILVWNARLVTSEPRTLDLEARLSAARDALFIRVPAELLTETIRTLSEVEPNWDQMIGRALATATTSEGAVADFAPERP